MAGGAVQPKRARLASAALLVAALAALLPGARGGAPLMWLQGVLDIDPLAVCNDGSPAGFYFVPGTTQSNIWLVYLEGGMWCARGAGAAAASALAPRAHRGRLPAQSGSLRTARGPHAPGAGGERRAWLPCGRADAAPRTQVLRPDVVRLPFQERGLQHEQLHVEGLLQPGRHLRDQPGKEPNLWGAQDSHEATARDSVR